ncbi:type II secretion system protein GspG [Paenarthrobacter sp. JL.01a]|uniref:type II secretion system protein GspG n=1 Tax=Paenarthrobacter sp. JL.01a TaxID=2979324 RepID=UPI0021C6C49A|nr:type II secretion system protein GspG [Paenarthrobacter sp. JL.01a]UXM91019.1 type II secretion system protein GspG [Paenarthrobacter sp. JL.01a]
MAILATSEPRRQGFTIVELLIVIVVIAILASITVVAYNGIQERARTTTVNSDLAAIQKAMLMYRADHGTLPLSADWYSGTAMPPTSRWSTEIIAGLKNEKFIQTSGLDKDPWGQYYWYDNNDCSFGSSGNSPVKSVGPDSLLNTADDIGIMIKTNC